jgi:hypothetical protein
VTAITRGRLTDDDLLTDVTTYWVTGAIGASSHAREVFRSSCGRPVGRPAYSTSAGVPPVIRTSSS